MIKLIDFKREHAQQMATSIMNTPQTSIDEKYHELLNGLETFDSDLVYDTISKAATDAERTADKFYKNEIEMIRDGNKECSDYWNTVAKENENNAKSLRGMMTHLVRMQKGNNVVKRGWKLVDKSKKLKNLNK